MILFIYCQSFPLICCSKKMLYFFLTFPLPPVFKVAIYVYTEMLFMFHRSINYLLGSLDVAIELTVVCCCLFALIFSFQNANKFWFKSGSSAIGTSSRTLWRCKLFFVKLHCLSGISRIYLLAYTKSWVVRYLFIPVACVLILKHHLYKYGKEKHGIVLYSSNVETCRYQ